ncbi:unnamed protein product [Miscanthus lutarioriparius]|uniref:Aldose 1-epimerase n=1 Tax=Miscanthus lutarioriparius TaxID=422564 RepID=A0A811SGI8_9POAL|nr:unnamed protein product [Miscanthus lutarioriparius]
MARAALLPISSFLLCLALAGGTDEARQTVGAYKLQNKKGDFSIVVTNWGATLMSVIVPDSKGNLANVVLGYDTPEKYVHASSALGTVFGRVTNVIANGSFVLDGKTIRLNKDGTTTLHGGHRGFNRVIWTVKEYVPGGDSPYITLYYHSFDGEEGENQHTNLADMYGNSKKVPGGPRPLDVYVTYQLGTLYELRTRMNATALNKATPVNLVNHAYWNLAGDGSGDVLGHLIKVFASRYTPVDSSFIPTGEIAPVSGTPYDLRALTPLGSRVSLVSGAGMAGFDINYAVDGDGFRQIAYLQDPASGRALEVWANQPGIQLYTGNWLRNIKG